MRAAAYRSQIDRAVEARVDERPHGEPRGGHGELGEEAQAEAGLDHALDPVVARRAEHLAQVYAAIVQLPAHRLEYFAVRSTDVRLLVQLGGRDLVAHQEPV